MVCEKLELSSIKSLEHQLVVGVNVIATTKAIGQQTYLST